MSVITYQGARYALRTEESALDGLLRGGADVAFSCRRGSCQTCLMRVVSGAPGESAQRGLRRELIETGHFMPCVCHPTEALTIEGPDLSQLRVKAVVSQWRRLDARVVRLSLETELTLSCRPGQYVNLRRADGLTRSYSVRSLVSEDYFIEVDVQQVSGGAFSTWAQEELSEGDWLELQGPLGDCHYREEDQDRPLILIGTGTGIAPLHGVARDALASGHRGGIWIYYGARRAADLYARAELEELVTRGAQVRSVVLEGESMPGITQGDLVEVAFRDHADASTAILFLCGDPDLVQRARAAAVLAGARRSCIRADPFESPLPSVPRDLEIIRGIQADPELWEALERGKKLRAILSSFYDDVYEDARLGPFFHNVTKERAISKQYEFLADLFAGTRRYFGMKPFNAHHWMVISDELFDYREALFEDHLRRHGLSEPLLRRFAHLHELFRREIVKNKARGLLVDGVEQIQEGFQEELLEMASICDGCGEEMLAGSTGRMHKRTGQLFCSACGAVGKS